MIVITINHALTSHSDAKVKGVNLKKKHKTSCKNKEEGKSYFSQINRIRHVNWSPKKSLNVFTKTI